MFATSAVPVGTMLTPSGWMNRKLNMILDRLLRFQVLSSEQGWSVQPRGKPATTEDQEERCWELLQPQVFKQVEFNSTCDVVKA